MFVVQPDHWLTQKALPIGGALTAVIVAFALYTNMSGTRVHNGVPLPFASQEASLAGKVAYFTERNGVEVYEVTYEGEASETLKPDRIYIVHVPKSSDVANVPLDEAVTTAEAHLRDANYYGYKYVDAAAFFERRDVGASAFKDRFPGQFFASAKARSEDIAHGSPLALFEERNGITFKPTAGTDAVRLDPTGSLYVFIVNDPGGAFISVRSDGYCGDTRLNIGEECDDGNPDDDDSCKNTCTFGDPPPEPSVTGTKLGMAVQTIAADGTVLRGAQDITLLRVDVGAMESVRLSRLTFSLEKGSFLSAENYSLWKDSDGDGHVDTVVQEHVQPQDGLLTFDRLEADDGQLIPRNSSVTLEVVADITVDGPEHILQLKVADDQTDYVAGYSVASPAPLTGIRTNGACSVDECQMSVLSRPSIEWTITDSDPVPNACGNGDMNDNGSDGIAGNDDDEQCDDGDTDNGDGCSDICKNEE